MTGQPAPQPRQILALPMPQPNDANAATVRAYLIALLAALWREGDGFNGKRPFGTSCWESDLYIPLIRAGHVAGKIDEEDGWLDEIGHDAEREAEALIADAIQALGAAT